MKKSEPKEGGLCLWLGCLFEPPKMSPNQMYATACNVYDARTLWYKNEERSKERIQCCRLKSQSSVAVRRSACVPTILMNVAAWMSARGSSLSGSRSKEGSVGQVLHLGSRFSGRFFSSLHQKWDLQLQLSHTKLEQHSPTVRCWSKAIRDVEKIMRGNQKFKLCWNFLIPSEILMQQILIRLTKQCCG